MRSLLSLVYLIPRFHSSEREPIRIVIDGANHAKSPFLFGPSIRPITKNTIRQPKTSTLDSCSSRGGLSGQVEATSNFFARQSFYGVFFPSLPPPEVTSCCARRTPPACHEEPSSTPRGSPSSSIVIARQPAPPPTLAHSLLSLALVCAPTQTRPTRKVERRRG